jgi:hypothetical protein
MADLNLIDFYRDAALTLLQLQVSFPRQVELYVEDLIGPDHTDEFGLHSKRHEACLGAMLWLAEEGYLRYHSLVRQDAIDKAVLTAKALVLLNSPADTAALPDTPHPTADDMPDLPATEREERRTLGAQLRAAIDAGSSERLVRVMRLLLAQGRH